MNTNFLIAEETKVTSQHQITIPKPIWERLKLKEGIRFSVFLTENNDILVKPKDEMLELSDDEWNKLVSLAYNKKNISKKFKKASEAVRYLKAL